MHYLRCGGEKSFSASVEFLIPFLYTEEMKLQSISPNHLQIQKFFNVSILPFCNLESLIFFSGIITKQFWQDSKEILFSYIN